MTTNQWYTTDHGLTVCSSCSIPTNKSLVQLEGFIGKETLQTHQVKHPVHCVVGANHSDIPVKGRRRKSIKTQSWHRTIPFSSTLPQLSVNFLLLSQSVPSVSIRPWNCSRKKKEEIFRGGPRARSPGKFWKSRLKSVQFEAFWRQIWRNLTH